MHRLLNKSPYFINKIKNTKINTHYAVKKCGLTINYITSQDNKLCEIAVKQNGLALQFITDQTEKICKLAVQQNGYAIQYVNDYFLSDKQYEEICILAVKQNITAIVYVKKFTKKIIDLDINKHYFYYYNGKCI